MVDFIKKNKLLIGLSVFLLAVLYVFFPVLGKYAALHAPDSMPFFYYNYSSVIWANVMGGQSAFTPHTLYWLLFNPLYAHELTYVVDTLVLSLGALYYLRGRGVSPLAAWCGALALGFCGYTFTLFCAGHRGYFHMISSAIWAFGLIDRGFQFKRLYHFALIGLIFAWGIAYQPDVFILVGSVAALYALWLSFVAGGGIKENVLKVWPRFLIAIVFLAIAGYGGIRKTLTTHVGVRKAQISGASSQNGTAVNGKADDAQAKRDQWLFATNWSLPPEDALEFIVPGVFGNESMHGEHPYWGRLGQPHKSLFKKGQMMPNYRQHTVYFGVVGVTLAFFAIMVWLYVRKAPDADENGVKSVYRDVPFWAGVLVICLLLAMGRYTPLYRLFYAIPYMDLIRAPVKFLHLVEVASAMLCGFGAHALLSCDDQFSLCRKRFVWVLGSFITVLVIAACIFMASKTGLTEHVKELRVIRFNGDVADYAIRNIGRSILFLLPLAFFWFAIRKSAFSPRISSLCGMALIALVVMDQALVAKRYVKKIEVRSYYEENVLVKALKKDCPDAIPRVLSYVGGESADWLRKTFSHNGIVSLMPSTPKTPYAELFADLQSNPQHLWKVINVKYLILPYKMAEQLIQGRVAKPLLIVDVRPGVVRKTTQPNEKSLVLLALSGVKSEPRLLTQWSGGVSVEEQCERVATERNSVLSDAECSQPAGVPKLAAVKGVVESNPFGSYHITVETDSDSESLLIFNRNASSVYEHTIDGEVVKSSVASGVLSAVKVPSGSHVVGLRRSKLIAPLLLSFLSILLVSGIVLVGKIKK